MGEENAHFEQKSRFRRGGGGSPLNAVLWNRNRNRRNHYFSTSGSGTGTVTCKKVGTGTGTVINYGSGTGTGNKIMYLISFIKLFFHILP
jgi:hypothetical protein